MNRAKPKKNLSIDSEQQFDGGRQSWAHPQTTRDNYAQRRDGETMFDFIKRRKKYAIQQEISKKKTPSKEPYSEQYETERTGFERTPNKPRKLFTKSPDVSVRESHINRLYDDEYMTPRPSISPLKRLNVGDTQRPSRVNNRSLVEALSPFRKRVEESTQIKENTYVNNSQKSSFKKSDNRNIQNQKVLAKISTLNDQIQVCSRTAKACKNKSLSLLASTINMLDELSNESSSRPGANKKRIAQMRLDLKSLQKLYQQFQSLFSQVSAQEILRIVKERLFSIESNSQKQHQNAFESELNSSIQHYEKQLKAKDKELDKCRRDLEKLEQKFEKERQRESYVFEEKQKEDEKKSKETRDRVQQWKEREQDLQNRNSELQQELLQVQAELKQQQKENKTLEHQKSSLIKSFEQERASVETAKQKVLIEEMNRLKKQSQIDLMKIEDLYKMKELKYLDELRHTELLLKDQQGKHRHCAKMQDVSSNELDIFKTQIYQLRAENDKFRMMIIRLEDQSFVLWGALKDVKILSCRLGLFNKFSRIYDDIRFSDVALR